MSKIQVLALNDDNHATCFVTRGSFYSDAGEFMKKCLLKPHTVEYDLRFVYIYDIDEEEESIFDALTCEYHPETLFDRNPQKWENREKAFEHLWRIAETNNFYI
jgi:hypothetical protein